MTTPISNTRAGQKAVKAVVPTFNGVLSVLLLPVDAKKLTFNANVTASTGNAQTPQVTFTPCDDFGKVRTFGSSDDVINWLKGAFLDITALSMAIDDMETVSNKFIAPTDPVKDATSQKARYIKLRDGMVDNLAEATRRVDVAVAMGWNTSPYAQVVARYNDLVTQKTSAIAINAFYVSEIARLDAIINA